MNQDLQIVTTVTMDLYEHLNAVSYLLFQKKKNWIYCSFCTIFFVAYYGFLYSYTDNKMALLCAGPIFLAILLVTIYFRCNTKSVAKRLAKRAMTVTRNTNALIRYTFYPDHLMIETSQSVTNNGYDEIKFLAETSEYFFLVLSNGNAHSVKKSNLGPDNIDIFRKYMYQKTGLTFQQINY